MENGRKGLAEVLAGTRGEEVAAGKKLEATGFTRPEVLGGRKEDRASQETKHSCRANPSQGTSHLQIPVSGQTEREHPQPQAQPSSTRLPPLITLWLLLEAGRGHPACAGCCRPKLSHGAQELWAQALGLKLGVVQWETKSLLFGQGPQGLGRGVAVEPGR